MKKFFCVFLSVLVSVSVFVLCLSAEDLVRDDPLLSVEEHSVLRSVSSPEYLVLSSGFSTFKSWLVDQGYTSRDNAWLPDDPVYCYNVASPSSSFVSLGLFVDGDTLRTVFSQGSGPLNSGYDLGFDSPELYSFFRYTVGIPYSDFDFGGSNSSILGNSLDLAATVFTVGGSLLSFITSSWVTVVALVAFLLVLGFGVIRRLVKGV